MSSGSDTVEDLLQKLVSGELSANDIQDSDVAELRNRLNPLGRAIKLEDPTEKLYAYSLINLAEEYQKKLLMTGMISFLFRMADEFGVPAGDYVTPVRELNREQIMKEFVANNVIDGKVVLAEEKKAGVSGGEGFSQEESVENKLRRIHVHDFLKTMFEFNPDIHVRSAYQRNRDDPERRKLSSRDRSAEVREAAKVAGTLDEPKTKALLEYLHATQHIPPADLFHRFKMYYDGNYDALRIATSDLYCEKPDLDYLLIIYNQFNDEAGYKKFVHDHEGDVTADVKCCVRNQWTFQANFQKNRDRQMFYNKNTRVLQEMLDATKANHELGSDMMKKRMKMAKAANVEECGTDDKAFLENYKAERAKQRKKDGLTEVTAREREKLALEEKYLNKFDLPSDKLKDNKDGVEVQMWTHDTKTRRMVPDSFLTESKNVDTVNQLVA